MKYRAFILFSTFSYFIFCQSNVRISDVSNIPGHPSSVLEVESITKGMLIPRMNTAQRLAISSPATSLLVYDTNDNLFYFWNSTQWVPFPQQAGSNNIALNFDTNTGVLSLTDNGGTLTTNIPPDNDSNPTNEFNTAFSFNSNTNLLSITDAGGTFNADLSPLLSNDWRLLGNAGTNPTNNFLGTTDNQDLVFRTNNSEKVRVLSNGNVGIGTTTPAAKLEVFGGSIHTINNGYSVNNAFAYSSGVDHPVFMGIRGEGTFTAPSYPTSGKVLSSFIGRDALDYGAANYGGASLYMVATENFSQTAKGTRLVLSTTSNGSNVETERMTIQHNGNVGIGTSNPTSKLCIDGVTPITEIRSGGYLMLRPANNSWDMRLQSVGQRLDVFSGGNLTAPITSFVDGGRVGIGTTNPQAKLHVAGSIINASGTGRRFGWNLPEGTTNAAPSTVAYFEGDVLASLGFYAINNPNFSDRRIKNILGVSNQIKDAEILSKIEITDYKLIDTISFDKRTIKKVIAQQVEKVYPEAIYEKTNYIPSVFGLTSNFSENKVGLLEIELQKTHDFKEGDKIQINLSNGKQHFTRVEKVLSPKKFSIQNNDDFKNVDQILVYGKEINDFKSVDYDALTTLNISTTQHLIKKIKELEEENKQLKITNSKAIEDLRSEFEKLKTSILTNP